MYKTRGKYTIEVYRQTYVPLYIMYGTVSVQQANLPENASRDDAILP